MLYANENQILAIQQINGPILIIAGPGYGKTFTLVERRETLKKAAQILSENT